MERDKLSEMAAWKDRKGRRPLVLRGARQTGKTWLMKEFGKRYFKKTVYVNFENAPQLMSLFSQDLNVKRILNTLQIYAETQITPEDTLIIFDEIQSVGKGLTSLKYFCEDAPEYAVVAAGSLLGMGLHTGVSFPVGKVEFMDLHPMSFLEYLRAEGKQMLADAISVGEWETLGVMHNTLVDYLKKYLFVGGMPGVVQTWLDTNDYKLVRQVQNDILHSYHADFSKHAPYDQVPRIQMVWQSIPSQLSKENKKFIYGVIREGARAKDFELAIGWLVECGLLIKCHRVSKPSLPLSAYQDLSVFKLFLLDVGLLGAMSGLSERTIMTGSSIFTEFKGAQAEQFVIEELVSSQYAHIGYWTNERSTAEVDFIVQSDDEVIPIEVKADVNVRAKSFKFFCEKYRPSRAYRASLLPYRKEEWMTNLPLYAIGAVRGDDSHPIAF